MKLTPPPGKTAEFLIINGVECEPYLTADHRVMLERGEELLVGVSILAKALGVKKSYIGIENNKPDAISHLQSLAAGFDAVEVVPLKVKYRGRRKTTYRCRYGPSGQIGCAAYRCGCRGAKRGYGACRLRGRSEE